MLGEVPGALGVGTVLLVSLLAGAAGVTHWVMDEFARGLDWAARWGIQFFGEDVFCYLCLVWLAHALISDLPLHPVRFYLPNVIYLGV